MITHVEGDPLPEPCPAQLFLHFRPAISCRMESGGSSSQSQSLLDSLYSSSSKNLRIKITKQCGLEIEAKNVFSIQKLQFGSSTSKCGFTLIDLPYTAIQSDIEIKSMTFSLLNFPRFLGWEDEWISRDGHSHQLGVMEAETHDGWFVKVREVPDLMEKEEILKRENGYAITHTGLIKRCDGGTSSVEDAENILRRLRMFLSFARGAACGLVLVKADVMDGRSTTLQWGTTYTEPWVCGGATWLPFLIKRGDSLRQLLPGFWNLSDRWKDDMVSVVDWYLNGKNHGSVSSKIISIQAALELLSHKILQSLKQVERGKKEEMLRNMLEMKGVDAGIPASREHLKEWLESEGTKNLLGKTSVLDGPAAIVKIRNDLVHADRRLGDIPLRVLADALHLGLWYTEVILLKECCYSGPYSNRLTGADEVVSQKDVMFADSGVRDTSSE